MIRVVDARTGPDRERAVALVGTSGAVASAAAVLLAVEGEQALGCVLVGPVGPSGAAELSVHVPAGPRAHRVVRTLVDAAVRRAPSVGVLRLLVDVDPAEAGLFVTTGFRLVEGAGPARYERTLR